MVKQTLALGAAVAALALSTAPAQAAGQTINNGSQFVTTTGGQIDAHGGGVIKVGSYYYFLGENRNPDYSFRAVSMYRSTDLKTWEFRNDVLKSSSATELNGANISNGPRSSTTRRPANTCSGRIGRMARITARRASRWRPRTPWTGIIPISAASGRSVMIHAT